MNDAENLDEQSPNPAPRRFDECACDPVRGEYDMRNCHCSTDEDGRRSHGGTTPENAEHLRSGYPRHVSLTKE